MMVELNREQRPVMRRTKRKLDPELVRDIRRDWEIIAAPNRNAFARKYGVSISTIDAVVQHRIWKKLD